VSSLGSQLGAQLGQSSQMSGISGQITTFNTQAAQGQAIAGIGSNVFNAFGGMDTIKKSFN
jgi:uncharacterized BrkB/YihY/UPF0761 family membrane protein